MVDEIARARYLMQEVWAIIEKVERKGLNNADQYDAVRACFEVDSWLQRALTNAGVRGMVMEQPKSQGRELVVELEVVEDRVLLDFNNVATVRFDNYGNITAREDWMRKGGTWLCLPQGLREGDVVDLLGEYGTLYAQVVGLKRGEEGVLVMRLMGEGESVEKVVNRGGI